MLRGEGNHVLGFVGKHEVKIPLRVPRRRWEYDSIMDLK